MMRKLMMLFVVIATSFIGSFTNTSVAAAVATQITGLQSYNVDTSSATISWNTNVLADGKVQYSTVTPVPTNAPAIVVKTTSYGHTVQLTGLNADTNYFYKVTSCGSRSNGCSSANSSFKTLSAAVYACNIVPPRSGTWQTLSSPTVTAGENYLQGVVALSDTNVWEVGYSNGSGTNTSVQNTLIEHYDGVSWNIVPSPNSSESVNRLYGIAASSPVDIWAVGTAENFLTSSGKTLIEHYDGVSWQRVPSPNSASAGNALRSVVAISPTNAWAVGYKQNTNSAVLNLILHWDGFSWSEVASPNPNSSSSHANQLFGITAISANNIIAVGQTGNSPLSLRWDGFSWNVITVPLYSGSSSAIFYSVAAASNTDIWAVGKSTGFFSNNEGIHIERFDGVAWQSNGCINQTSTTASGLDLGNFSYLISVSASSPSNVWMVGQTAGSPLTLHYDGSSLVVVPAATVATDSYNIAEAVATSPFSFTAFLVGEQGPGFRKTLSERYVP